MATTQPINEQKTEEFLVALQKLLADFDFDGISGVALHGGHCLKIALFDTGTVKATDKQFEEIFAAVDDLAQIVVDSIEVVESNDSLDYGPKPSDN